MNKFFEWQNDFEEVMFPPLIFMGVVCLFIAFHIASLIFAGLLVIHPILYFTGWGK